MSNVKLSQAEMSSLIEKLQAENETLKLKATKPAARISLKVSSKGGVSLYGLGRFPVTLYAEQWERVLALAPSIADFIAANKAHLATPEMKAAAKAASAAATPPQTPTTPVDAAVKGAFGK